MKFNGTRCDECGRIQGEANHWQAVAVCSVNSVPFAVALGNMTHGLFLATRDDSAATQTLEFRDLCGQGCAMRHVAKLLGWSSVLEQKD